MNDEHVCLMLLTYNRLDYAKITLLSALENIEYDGPLSVHIADDGSSEEYRKELVYDATKLLEYSHPEGRITVTNSERRGYGASYNIATQVIHQRADYVLCLEDDWKCLRTLKLGDYLPALQRFGCVRMGYIGFTQELRTTLHYINGAMWMRFYENSREPHVWAGHPRLETIAWQKSVGPWPELLEPGRTEFEVCHKPNARLGVVWPIEFIKPSGDLFCHIGTERSY